MDTIKENPVPAALVGVGLGWLLVDAAMKQQQKSHRSSVGVNGFDSPYYSDSGYGNANGASYGAVQANNNFATANNSNGVKDVLHTAGDKLHHAGEKIGDTIDSAKSRVSDSAHDLKDKASDIAQTVQQKASDTTALVQTKASDLGHAAQATSRKAVHATQDFVTDNPLAAGAIALLVGAVIGLALPSTEQENKLVGTYRDQLVDQASSQANDLLGKVQNIAGETLNVAKSQLSEVRDTVADSVKNQVRDQGLVAA